MGLDAMSVFSSMNDGVKKITNSNNLEHFKTINRIGVVTVEGDIYFVNTSKTTCTDCWAEMMSNGYVSVLVDTSKGQVEHLIRASLVKEMFLGSRSR